MTTQGKQWRRLDNAAKIFPSTSEKTDTRVFRFSCELNETIDRCALQKATVKALKMFPIYQCVMKKGLFWYYLEQTEQEPVVREEYKQPCSALYMSEADRLLFEVTYYKKRINLEIYHVLADGTGAIQFLKNIVYNYLIDVHGDRFCENLPDFDYGNSISDKSSDSFRKYYRKQKRVHTDRVKKVFRLRGYKNEDNVLNITEAQLSAKSLINAAHKHHTTMTVFLTAVFIEAIHKEMTVADEKKTIVIMVPVNLRNFFPSDTAKNFFGMISVKYNYSERSGELEDIISSVDEQFREQLTKEKLSVRMNRLAALEHNPFVKIAPLPFKNFVLRIARQIGLKNETVVISNLGRIEMPAEFDEYIKSISVFASTLKLQLCLCSFGDCLSLGFSSAFISTNVQRNFICMLTADGIDACINCNMFNSGDEEDKSNAVL